jgi:hypothetical protein
MDVKINTGYTLQFISGKWVAVPTGTTTRVIATTEVFGICPICKALTLDTFMSDHMLSHGTVDIQFVDTAYQRIR